ncbi:hypothetical protein Hanom_Chr13g01184371 [Helianthus anomalus]
MDANVPRISFFQVFLIRVWTDTTKTVNIMLSAQSPYHCLRRLRLPVNRVEVSNEKISIFDIGPGMDSTSIEKWRKMGASLHRAYKTQDIGGKPPY